MNSFFSGLAITLGLLAIQNAPATQDNSLTSNDETKQVDTDHGNASQSAVAPGISFANPVFNNWQIGVQIRGGRGSAKNMTLTLPIPTNWPEQEVSMVGEVLPPEVRSTKPRSLNSGVQQMVVVIPRVPSNTVIELNWTYRVATSSILAPKDTSVFVIPKKVPRYAKEYLGVGPQITYRNSKLRKQVKTIVAEQTSAWSQVEAIFDWVRKNIEYVDSKPEDSIHVFRKRKGCAEDLVGLFVAMCRANKVPARVVWVEGHQHAEFMLLDASGKDHWFPAQVAGMREFGSIAEPRIVLQKGDNIKVPEKEKRQKFVGEFAKCSGNSKPKVRFYRKLLPAEKR